MIVQPKQVMSDVRYLNLVVKRENMNSIVLLETFVMVCYIISLVLQSLLLHLVFPKEKRFVWQKLSFLRRNSLTVRIKTEFCFAEVCVDLSEEFNPL